ncbi:hypothetical protein ACC730_38470, partial [Rhizobium ruizarguesonis]
KNQCVETPFIGKVRPPSGPWKVLWNVVIPLAKPGMAIGTIFVVTLVMADFSTVQVMSGGQRASVALMMKNQMSLLQYP